MSIIKNFEFYWVRKGVLAGSSKPYSPKNIQFIADQGIKRIISISEPTTVRLIAKDFPNIEVIPFEFSDFGIPTIEQLESFFLIMDESIKAHKPVLVHCAMGCGRTGLLLTIFIMKFENKDWKTSLNDIRTYRPCAVESSSQLDFLSLLTF